MSFMSSIPVSRRRMTYDLEPHHPVRSERPDLPIVVDDNYTVLNVPRIGVELGAAYSCFSGLSCSVLRDEDRRRKGDGIAKIHERNYSGGGQVQG